MTFDELVSLSREVTEQQTMRCTMYGHEFQAGIFEFPVCVCCGARHTDNNLPDEGVPVFIWYTGYPMLVYRRGELWYGYINMETKGVLSGVWRYALPHEVLRADEKKFSGGSSD